MDVQFKKGLLELCVLGIVYDRDCYGYELVEKVSEIIDISRGTLYPLLKRLQDERFLEYYILESSIGPPRKYYRITPEGREYFSMQRKEWYNISNSLNKFLEGV